MIDLFITSRDDWRNQAACRPEDGEIDIAAAEAFFPVADPGFDKDGRHGRQFIKQAQPALTVCHRCPVRDACLRDALRAAKDGWAVVGGTLPGQRAMLRKQLALTAA